MSMASGTITGRTAERQSRFWAGRGRCRGDSRGEDRTGESEMRGIVAGEWRRFIGRSHSGNTLFQAFFLGLVGLCGSVWRWNGRRGVGGGVVRDVETEGVAGTNVGF